MASISPVTSVLVAGAGPTGLTAALCLAKAGIAVRIVEEAEHLHSAARGTAILPRTQELLAILGAQKDVQAIATPPLQMAVYGPGGKNIVKAFDWSQGAGENPTIPFANTASIGQSVLEAILHKHLEANGGKVELGRRLVSIEQDDQKVKAKVEASGPGSSGSEEIVCDYLICADGAKGRSRRLLGISFLGETKEADRMLSANLDVPGFSREYWHRWGDFAKAAISLKPINPAPNFQLQALGPELPSEVPKNLKEIQDLFNSISGREDLKFENMAWISEWRANIRMTDKFSIGRVFLAGDVAHCHSPAGGQGTNTAMQDAFNLSWKLALVIKGKASPDLLSSYEAERMPVVAEMLSLSTDLHAKAFPHIPSSAFDDPPPNPAAAADPMLRSSKLLQLGINYRWSQIVYDERYRAGKNDTGDNNPYGALGEKPRAGDRAPYVPSLTGIEANLATDLFELIGTSHLLLIFPKGSSIDTEPIKEYLSRGLLKAVAILRDGQNPDVPDVPRLVDASGVSLEAYDVEGSDRDVWVVVRPDGIIGAYGYGPSTVQHYFTLLGA